MPAQSAKPLYLAAALYAAAGTFHYAHGWDLQVRLPLPARFDLQRDGREDLATALAEAKASGRRVLVLVGGDWCPPCETIDRFMGDDPGLAAIRERGYVLLRVAVPQVGLDNPALEGLPPPDGYPHLYVLDSDGRPIASKNTEELELGSSYDLAKFKSFLLDPAPK